MSAFDDAWAAAEVACAAEPSRVGRPWPRLQGPFPTLTHGDHTYQATVNDPDGGRRDDQRIGLGNSPTEALQRLVDALRVDPPLPRVSDERLTSIARGEADGPRACTRWQCGGLPPHPASDHVGPGLRT